MSTGRSSPSGKALQLTPDLAVEPSGNPVQGVLNVAILQPNAQATVVAFGHVNPTGAAYLVAMDSTIQSTSGTPATGAVKLLFTPQPVGPVRTINSRAYSVGSSTTQFRLMPQVVDINEAGYLSIVFDTTGSAENVSIENANGSIQPVMIATE